MGCFISIILDVLIYTLFVPVLADSEAIADELNPLTISHIARTISFKAIGRAKKIVDAVL
jgi:hypothetical protein